MTPSALPDLVCFSHLRWDFVYQRPQHLMSRFARTRRVTFVEEPVREDIIEPQLRVSLRDGGVRVVVPVLPTISEPGDAEQQQRQMLCSFLASESVERPTFWFQTPMAVAIAPLEEAGVVIYDCMDELSAFDGAPPSLLFYEKQLLARADIVFTGGRALYEAKRSSRPNVHCVPSGIEVEHFSQARDRRQARRASSSGQKTSRPRIGFAGVIDERLDRDLLAAVAAERPEYDFVMVGPVVKIDPASLPQAVNIDYVGMRAYTDLPAIMSGWDAAIMPFARNAATRFISPTKTPEYLAAGLPVVSTPIRDVVRDYGERGLVAIAEDAASFARALDDVIPTCDDPTRLLEVDVALEPLSWDAAWARMSNIERAAAAAADVRAREDRAADAS